MLSFHEAHPRGVSRHRAPALLAALCLAPAAVASAEDFRFERLDRTYEDFVEALAPIEMGPAEITLSSPHQTLTLLSHLASLQPLGGGRFAVTLTLEVEGHGQLDALVRMGVIRSRLEDVLELPRQSLSGWGEIQIARGDAGYDITLLRSQETLEVDIRSRMAGRIVPLCRQMGLVLIRLDCAAMEAALSHVSVPLPPPGTQFFLSLDELTPEETAALDAFVAPSALDPNRSGSR